MKLNRTAALLCAVVALAAPSAMGAFTFNNGDLILGVQATSGMGSTQNVFFNLGAGTSFRDNPVQGELGNIGATLTLVYGAGWYDRSDLWFGVIGNLSASPASGFGSVAPVNGDPSRTFYVSTPADTVADGVLYNAGTFPSSSLGSAGTNLAGLEANLPGFNTELDGAAILSQATQPVQWNNSWTAWNPTPGASFGIFTGGIQQHFGQAGDETYVDLQRILATNTGANPTGVVGGGTYVTTFAITNDGSILAVPEPSSSLLGLLAGAAFVFRRRRA